jgi:hypothetical protein
VPHRCRRRRDHNEHSAEECGWIRCWSTGVLAGPTCLLALHRPTVRDHDLERLTIRKADRRYRPVRYHDAVETEALRQTIIADIVRARLDALLPEPLARELEREEQQRRSLINS